MKNILLLLFLTLSLISFSQIWSEPVQISTLQGYNAYPDFYIGNDGTIHCVWSYRYNQNHRVIFYSKSIDIGETWSEPEDVSQNDTLWMENPHIVADSENNLHLTYDYNSFIPNGTLIMYRYYNGESWTEADTVSPGWYGARQNRLVIDNNDLLYCFWYHDMQNGTAMYRVLENGVWSDIYIPYDNYDQVFFQKGVVDENNNIYCTGVHHYVGQSAYDDRVISFNFIDNNWQPWDQLSDDTSWGGIDIGLSSTNHPAVVWGQDLSESKLIDGGTFISNYNGTNWSLPELIIEYAYEQAMSIDMYDHVHIVHHEEYDDTKPLIHYQKMNSEWIGEIIEENQYGFYCNKLIFHGHFIHLLSARVDTIIGSNSQTSITYRYFDILTTTHQHQSIRDVSLSIYPNPAAGNLNISFNIIEGEKTEIKVFDHYGKLIKTLLNNYKSPGKYKLRWDTTDNEGNIVKPGTYFIQIKTGIYIMTKRVMVVN